MAKIIGFVYLNDMLQTIDKKGSTAVAKFPKSPSKSL